MEIYYAPSTSGFYVSDVHKDIPGDAVAISAELHAALLEGESAGLVIMPPDADHDEPYLADPPPPTTGELSARARAKRDALLAATDYLMMPDYPVSEDTRAAVTAYRQALRDITGQEGFPGTVIWPEKPEGV